MRPSKRLTAAVASVCSLISVGIASGGVITVSPVFYMTSEVAGNAGSVAVPNAESGATIPSPDYIANFFSGTVAAENASGQIAFYTNTSNGASTPVTQSNALISTGTLTSGSSATPGSTLAQYGYAVPGTTGNWSNYSTIEIDGAGHVTIFGLTSTSVYGVWSDRSGTMTNLAVGGGTLAGFTLGTINPILTMDLNPSGNLAYAMFNSTTSTYAIAEDTTETNGTGPVLLESGNNTGTGSAAPGSAGTTIGNFKIFSGLTFNPNSQLAFYGTLNASSTVLTSGTSENDKGIWANTGSGGSLQLIARMYDPAPGLTNVNFGAAPTSFDFNGAGQVAFTIPLLNAPSTTGVTSLNNSSLWVGTSESNLSLVARTGVTAAPGATGATFNNTIGTPVINHLGEVAFQAYVVGGTINDTGAPVTLANYYGVFEGTPGNLINIAYKGDAAPGVPGATFGTFGNEAINALGEVVFSNSLTGGSTGYWATDANGMLTEMLYPGMIFDVNGSFETVKSFGVNLNAQGGEDGRATAWNDSGDLAATINFTDGTAGVFEIAVPEPTSLALLSIPVLAMLGRRRRRFAGHTSEIAANSNLANN
jgi:hypothetical protein